MRAGFPDFHILFFESSDTWSVGSRMDSRSRRTSVKLQGSDQAGALAAYQESLDIRRKFVAQDQDNAEAQRDVLALTANSSAQASADSSPPGPLSCLHLTNYGSLAILAAMRRASSRAGIIFSCPNRTLERRLAHTLSPVGWVATIFQTARTIHAPLRSARSCVTACGAAMRRDDVSTGSNEM
jgi:hypothetical protein